jgi:hypothetical protein
MAKKVSSYFSTRHFSISPKEILMTLAKVTTPVTLVAIVGINTRILWAGNIFSLGRAQKRAKSNPNLSECQ